MNRIIAVEGIGGSGKTTLIEEMGRRGYQIVPELSAEIHQHFPPFSTDTSEAIVANNWFLQREVERCSEVKTLVQKGSVIADRWYHSIFAVSYARNALFGTNDGDALASELRKLKESGLLFTPNIVIVDTPFDLVLERLEKRYGSIELMERLKIASPDLLRKEKEYYLGLREPEQIIVDGRVNVKNLADKVIRHFQ